MDERTQRLAPARDTQRSHQSQRFSVPLRLESLSAKDCVSTKHRIRAYADDLTVWEGKPGGPSKSWDSLTRTLRKAGLDMEPRKYIAWRPHDPANSEPVIPSVEVETGLIVLGSTAVDGSEMPLGAPMLDESNFANDLHARESRQSSQAGQRN